MPAGWKMPGRTLREASELADKESKTYFDLWLVSIDGRLGVKKPKFVTKRAASEAHGEWPRPALAMMTGSMSPEELLKRMDEKKGDDRQMALAEGYFYLGQHYLVTGDKKAAGIYFQKTRDLDVCLYIEHVAAGFELQRLKNDDTAASAAPVSNRAVTITVSWTERPCVATTSRKPLPCRLAGHAALFAHRLQCHVALAQGIA